MAPGPPPPIAGHAERDMRCTTLLYRPSSWQPGPTSTKELARRLLLPPTPLVVGSKWSGLGGDEWWAPNSSAAPRPDHLRAQHHRGGGRDPPKVDSRTTTEPMGAGANSLLFNPMRRARIFCAAQVRQVDSVMPVPGTTAGRSPGS